MQEGKWLVAEAEESEEELSRKICMGHVELLLVEIEAERLTEGLARVLRFMEMTDSLVICILGEDRRKWNLRKLSRLMGVPVLSRKRFFGRRRIHKAVLKLASHWSRRRPLKQKRQRYSWTQKAVEYVKKRAERFFTKGKAGNYLAEAALGEEAWFYQDYAAKRGLDLFETLEIMCYCEQALLEREGATAETFRAERKREYEQKAAEIVREIKRRR